MQIPLELTFRGVEKTEAIERYIRERAQKLDQLCDHIVSCRVTVERPQQHQRAGSPFRVRLDVRVPPGHELVVRRESTEGDIHDSLRQVLREAFDAMRRQLRGLTERQRGDVKAHWAEEETGIVVRVFREEGYGFVRTPDGDEVYFHRNSVLRDGFDRLDVGTGVRLAVEDGEEGLQASTVEIIDKPGPRSGSSRASSE
jgi:cold shock CspA family protein/ribosome-associated translation inhibitor RaiA